MTRFLKKRYFVILGLLLLIPLSFGWVLPAPVRPVIQLPGERYPGSNFPVPFGPDGLTNTFCASLLAYALLFLLPFFARAWSRTSEEIPTGFYNFVELLVESGYNFVHGTVGERARDFFPFFMTFLLFLLLANLMGLVPGFDSVGQWENLPHFKAEKAVDTVLGEAGTEFNTLADEAERDGIPLNEAVAGALTVDAFAAAARETTSEEELLHLVEMEFFATGLPEEERSALLAEGTVTLEELEEAYLHHEEALLDAENIGDISTSNGEGFGWLLRAEAGQDNEKPEDADWTIVPFFRPASTDLSLTLAFALVSMFMVQVFGFKYLGVRYLGKFFAWPSRFIDTFAANPMQGIVLIVEPIVGIIELISEFAKIISFSFRLLGALFGGMVLLFVMAGILPLANLIFYGLELFVGGIQAFVFAFLTVIFMKNSTEHHGGHEEH